MSKKKTGDASADDEKGGHVRLSTEISRMLGWVWYLEREKTGQTQAQIVEELIRLGLAKRYGANLSKVKSITEGLGRTFEAGKVPQPPTRKG